MALAFLIDLPIKSISKQAVFSRWENDAIFSWGFAVCIQQLGAFGS